MFFKSQITYKKSKRLLLWTWTGGVSYILVFISIILGQLIWHTLKIMWRYLKFTVDESTKHCNYIFICSWLEPRGCEL